MGKDIKNKNLTPKVTVTELLKPVKLQIIYNLI